MCLQAHAHQLAQQSKQAHNQPEAVQVAVQAQSFQAKAQSLEKAAEAQNLQAQAVVHAQAQAQAQAQAHQLVAQANDHAQAYAEAAAKADRLKKVSSMGASSHSFHVCTALFCCFLSAAHSVSPSHNSVQGHTSTVVGTGPVCMAMRLDT